MALPDRVPPQNIEAEQAVLGAMMIKKEAIVEVQEILQPEDFYREAHRHVYEAMLDLTEHDEAVDLVTLTEQLRKTGELEVGGCRSCYRKCRGHVSITPKIVTEAMMRLRDLLASAY